MLSNTIMVVEDDLDISEILSIYLNNEGYTVLQAHSLYEARILLKEHQPIAYILDVNLPDGTGFEFAEELNSDEKPIIIFLTVHDTIDMKLKGFEIGADDYLTKPFIPKELVARLQANLKRFQSSTEQHNILTFDNLIIHIDEKNVYKNGELIELYLKEKQLLFYLVENRNRVVSFDTLLDHVWGHDSIVDHKTLQVHISTLRRKIEDVPNKPKWIHTVRGFGYKFNA